MIEYVGCSWPMGRLLGKLQIHLLIWSSPLGLWKVLETVGGAVLFPLRLGFIEDWVDPCVPFAHTVTQGLGTEWH